MNGILSQLMLLGWLLIGLGVSSAQTPASDVLYRLDRSTSKAKISEMTGTDVFYTEPATPNVPRRIRKAELWKVVFSDGTSDVFNTPKGSITASVPEKQSSIVSHEPVAAPVVRQQIVQQESATVQNRPGLHSDNPRSIIKYAPLSSFGYEHVLSNNHSIYGGISLYGLGFGVTAVGLKGEYRFYGLIKSSQKQAPEGFWVAPTVLFWNVSSRDFDGYSDRVFITQLGGIAGYQWVFNKKISLEPALGLSMTAVGSGSDSSLGAGLVPLFAVRVGYVLK